MDSASTIPDFTAQPAQPAIATRNSLLSSHGDDPSPQPSHPDDPDSFVVVRALYPYHPEDTATSLAFQKDDLIQVVSQLETGWWYGFCNDAQGWFPSNFVEEILQPEDLEHDDRTSTSGSDEETSGEDLWLPQTTADGQVYYFNTRTGDSSWTIPTSSFDTPASSSERGPVPDQGPASTTDQAPSDTALGLGLGESSSSSRSASRLGDDEPARSTSTYVKEQEQHMASTRALASVHEPTETDSRGGSTRPNSWQASALPTRAGSPLLQDDDGQPGPLADLRKPSGSSAPVVVAEFADGLPPLPPVSNPFETEPSWVSLAEHTSGALHNLVQSAEHGYKAYYSIQAAQVVESIRVMLYASGTIDKDSAPIRMNRGLKVHHRHIMAALSRLVLSAKMASSIWPPEGSVAKMRSDIDDVANSVNQFISVAQSVGVAVHDVDAKLILDTEAPMESRAARKLSRALSSTLSRPSFDSNADRAGHRRSLGSTSVLAQLDYYSKSACKAIALLSIQISKAIDSSYGLSPNELSGSRLSTGSSILNTAQASQLVAQCHQTISQIGSLLTLVTEFYAIVLAEHPTIKDHIFLDVRVSKQALYNNVAALVMAIQLATDPMAQSAVLEMTLERSGTVERSVMDLTAAARSLAVESDDAEKVARSNRLKSDSLSTAATLVGSSSQASQARQSEIDSYFQDQDSDMDGETAHNPRHRSNSQLSSFSSTSSVSGVSAPTTPGTEYTGRSNFMNYPFPLNISGVTPLEITPPNSSQPTIGETQKADIRGAKLKKMLGEDAPTPKPSKVTEVPWYLGHDYSPADISFNMEGHVRGGTLPALVERLTLHDGLDSNFIATFLLTYRSFATTSQFFLLLFKRFTIAPPKGLDTSELTLWTDRKLTPIRLRVFNIIKTWLENYYLEDEVEDRQILPKIKEFAESGLMRELISFPAVQLIKLVEKRETSDSSFKRMVLNMSTQAPPPILPRSLKRFRFMDLDPFEIARQLTIMEANYYNRIKPIECLAKAWTSEDPVIAAKAVNIKRMIETSNLYANWIDELVLSEKEPKKRAAVVKHLIAVAEKLRQLNNFSMLSATTAALAQSPIHRLKRTWEHVPAKLMNQFSALQAVTSSAKSWADYRAELHAANPPCVPFVGVYLTDLVMIQDGNPDFLKSTEHHINFYKRVSTAEVIREIQQYQSVPYCLTPVPELQTFIRRGLDNAKSVAELYEMSLTLEPRSVSGA